MSQQIKDCPGCGFGFSRDQLIHNPKVQLVGMNIEPLNGRVNYYHFKHLSSGCNTMFRLSVLEFNDLIPEPIPDHINYGQESCEKHCLNIEDHGECSQKCRWSPFRRFMAALLPDALGSSFQLD